MLASTRRLARPVLLLGLTAGLVATLAGAADAAVIPGTSGPDVHVGLDNDNANNTFIQPPGEDAVLHMDDADVVFGRDGDDLLVGNLGSDTIPAGKGADIMIGGPDASSRPNSDVLLGDEGGDIAVWAPGDGNDAYVGDKGADAMVLATLLTDDDGLPLLEQYDGRRIPRVDIGDQPRQRCVLEKIPPSQQFGAQYLVRLEVDGDAVGSVRLKDVERLLCPSSAPGKVTVADLTDAEPAFREVRIRGVRGTLGAIVAVP